MNPTDFQADQVFKIGQLVWAKIKGFPFWPSKVVDPKEKPDLKRSKKKNFCIQFFGSGEYSCLGIEELRPYFSFKDKFEAGSRKDTFVRALVAVDAYIAATPIVKTMEPAFVKPADDDAYRQWAKETRDADDDESDASDEMGMSSRMAKKPKIEISADKSPEEAPAKRVAKPRKLKNGHAKTSKQVPIKNGIPDLENIVDAHLVLKPNTLTPMNKKMGFIGLGTIGSTIAKRMLASGHDVLLCSRSVKDEELQDRELINTPKQLAEKCDLIFTCVSTKEDLIEIVCNQTTGILDSLDDTKAFVDFSSLDLITIMEMHRVITAKGCRFMDAPLFGTLQNARDNQLAVICSGDRSVFQEVLACLQASVGSATFVGSAGIATKVVMVIQILQGVMRAGFAEAFGLAEAMGLQAKEFSDILKIRSTDWISDCIRRLTDDEFVPAAIKLTTVNEQMKHGTCFANVLIGQPTPIASVISQLYNMASKNEHFTGHDSLSIFKALLQPASTASQK